MLRSSLLLAVGLQAVAAFTAPALRLPTLSSNVATRRPMQLNMNCPLTPLGANVIIKLTKASNQEKMTESGILMAASVADKGPTTGTGEAVVSGFFTESGAKIPIDEVAVGDKVMFRMPTGFEGRKMKVDEQEYYVLSVNDILAKI